MVRRALLYGLAAALVASLWAILGHYAPLGPAAPAVVLVPIAAIALAIFAARRAAGGTISFNDGFIQGATVSAVYAVAVGLLALAITLLLPALAAPAGRNVAVIAPLDGLSSFAVVGMNLAFGCLVSLIVALIARRG